MCLNGKTTLVAVSYEHRNDPLGSINGGEYLHLLIKYWFVKKGSTPWGV